MKKTNSEFLNGIRNITISGRIGTGKTTLANHLGKALSWQVLDGGKIFRKFADESGFHIIDKEKVPDKFDIAFEQNMKKLLAKEDNHIIQAHLAGFIAEGIKGVYKILVVCEDDNGKDEQSVRIDRLMNRDFISVEDAKKEVHEREEKNIEKFRRLYVHNDQNWVYWDKKYYDLIVNTYSHNQEEALKFVLDKIGYTKK